jgi:hypothetical protein
LDGLLKNGSFSTCIDFNEDGFYYHCIPDRNWPHDTLFPPFPVLSQERVGVIGFIISCDPSSLRFTTEEQDKKMKGSGDCVIPRSVWDKYRSVQVYNESFYSEWLSSLLEPLPVPDSRGLVPTVHTYFPSSSSSPKGRTKEL